MTDKLYRAWIQTLPSCITGRFSEWLPDLGEWRNPACHVRRGGESGTAYKAEFACVPMSHKEHWLQTDKGERECLLKYSRDPQLLSLLRNTPPAEATLIAKDWFDTQVLRYREMWRTRTGGAPWEAELINT
jgi:hypothetical protein